jgi:bifunctional non-homologous end joining protein LigD
MRPLPMLATAAAPFDDADYAFEIKWDGVRCLAAVEQTRWSLWGRHGVDYTARYPELTVLRHLPVGTVVDGELVVLHQGRADFPALLRRHQRRRPLPAGYLGEPVRYVLFDLLYARGQTLLREPLVRRRALLRELLDKVREPLLAYSEEVVGEGRAFFAQVVAQGHEGVMAKQMSSGYLPGRRSSAWRKIKPSQVIPCVIIGYTADRDGIERLLLAAVRDGALCYVGHVTRGLRASQAADLARRLRRRAQPVVPCRHHACWVEPEVYCRVQCQGWTCHGHLRHAVFRGLLETPS